MKARLNKRTIDEATYEGPGGCYLWDTELSAFGVRIYPTGRKSFVVNYWSRGRHRFFTIGQYGKMTLPQAREAALEVFLRVRRGEDPAAERRASRKAPTVADLADRHIAEHAKVKNKARSAKRARQLWDRSVLPKLGKRKVKDVARADVARLMTEMADTPAMANKALSLLSKSFNLAEVWGWRPEGTNPCRHVDRFREESRERYLSESERGGAEGGRPPVPGRWREDSQGPGAGMIRSLTMPSKRHSPVGGIELPPVWPIHGVGNHKPGEIEDWVRDSFRRVDLTAEVREFNWDIFADHSIRRLRDGVKLLDDTAESISNTAGLPLPASDDERADRLLQRIGDGLYRSVFRILVATALALLIIGPLFQFLVLLPSAVFDSISWERFGWVRAATRAVIAAGTLVFLGLLGLGLVRSLVRLSIAPLWVVVRRAGLLVLQPVILLLTVPVSVRFGSGLLTYVGHMVPLTVLGAVLNLVLSPVTGEFRTMISGIGWSLSMLMGVAALAGLHILLRRVWIGGPLKVTLDTVRYMGSEQYRATLQQKLDNRIKKLKADRGGVRRVLLLAHSLGSVIALDSLVNSSAWKDTDEVHLVSLGSPIKRFFIRLFPRYLFPDSVSEAAELVASRLRRFTWINLHRRWDYVGTHLGLARRSVGVDLCTGQGWRLLSSHTNYWSDDIVFEKIKKGLQRAEPVAVEASRDLVPTHLTPVAERAGAARWLASILRPAAVLAIVIVVGLASHRFVNSRASFVGRIKDDLVSLGVSGEKASADVTYHRTTEGAGEDSYYLHHFVVRLPEPHGELPPIEIPHNQLFYEAAYRFDYRDLADYVLDHCVRAEEKRWWQIFKNKKSIPCTRTAIPVVYDPDNPESFLFPGFPAQRSRWDGCAEGVATLLGAGFFAALCAAVALILGVPLLRLFLGQKAVD